MVYGNYFVCRKVGISENTYKYRSMDGLRGICAALVIFHHFYWRDGSSDDLFWSMDYLSPTMKSLAMLVGHLPVAVFFMISGFLFFFVASAKKPIIPFFRGRILRIYPPVLFSLLLAMLALLFVQGDGSCAVGVFKYIPTPIGFISDGAVCGLKMASVNSGILWTLIWEWRLYVFVPVLMLLMNFFKNDLLVILGLLAVTIALWVTGKMDDMSDSYLILFISGFLSAILSRKEVSEKNQFVLFFSGMALFLLCLAITKHVYHPLTVLSLIPSFWAVASGFSVFGLLTNSKLQLLGVTSFSVYLNHGVFQFISKHYLYDFGFYLWQTISVVLIAIAAPFLYKYIELAFQAKKLPSTSLMVKP
ncbi:acyltransferase [Klebsiella pneumoniae]|nr:acyltransferase [Klebsiella pneumoniae]VGF52922.1 acyltransferase [Klebsiella pneumoniae]